VPANPSPALRVALAYFTAWTDKDLDQVMRYVAEDIVCDAPPVGCAAPRPIETSWSHSSASAPRRGLSPRSAMTRPR